jgi:glutamate N-acetyltransferase/amino-acid N-acetyltransferase
MAEDVEGAGRVVTVEVVGARDRATARALGRLATDSALVRSAFYGGDPNWGRLLGAIGAGGLPFDPDAFGVVFQGITVAAGGVEAPFDRAALAAAMKEGPLEVTVRVGAGPGSATVLSAALTPEYVEFNGEYS